VTEPTYKLAHAAAWDAGNRSMRQAGRREWSSEDLAAASDEFFRILNPKKEEAAK
jgi:hypothetical protein